LLQLWEVVFSAAFVDNEFIPKLKGWIVLFNSLEFFFFLLLFLAVFPLARKNELTQNISIALFSFAFYAYGDLNFFPHLLVIGCFNYLATKHMVRCGSNKAVLYSILAIDLGFLFWGKLNLEDNHHLPLGISFYIFQAMSFVIDTYYRQSPEPKNFWHFQSFLFFFPQLLAGPICRGEELLKQLGQKLKAPTPAMIRSGVYLFSYGLLKKAVIADAIEVRMSEVFTSPRSISDALSWSAIIFTYGWQIYFDFSGYTDMARGLAKLIGVEIPLNFNFPYFSRSPKHFWNRWHITLSHWFRDYVYIPLGGSRTNSSRFVFAIATTFILSAIWHGLGIHFLVWGLWHGIWIILFHYFFKRVPPFVGFVLTMFIVFYGWIFFRVGNIQDAFHIMRSLTNFTESSFEMTWFRFNDLLVLSIFALMLELAGYTLKQNYQRMSLLMSDTIWAIGITAAMIFQSPLKEFIYFRF
jgi:alginate O-acetyltransferase complex protein AlgI